MKKLIALILALSMTVSLTACGGNSREEPPPRERNTTTASTENGNNHKDVPAIQDENIETSPYTTGNEVVTDEIIKVSHNIPLTLSRPSGTSSPNTFEGLYTGEWKDGKPNGYGIFIATTRIIPGRDAAPDTTDNSNLFNYEGEWVNGEMSGYGLFTSNDFNNLSVEHKVEGWFENNAINGAAIATRWPNSIAPRIAMAEFDSNIPVGFGAIYDQNRIFQGEFVNGHIIEGVITYSDGSVYQGDISAQSAGIENAAILEQHLQKPRGRLTFGDGTFYIEGDWARLPNFNDIEIAWEQSDEVRATAFTRMMHGPVKIEWVSGHVYEGNAITDSGGSDRGVLKSLDGTAVNVRVCGSSGSFIADNSAFVEALGLILAVGFMAMYADIAFSAELDPAFEEAIRSFGDIVSVGFCNSSGCESGRGCSRCGRCGSHCICARNNYSGFCDGCKNADIHCRCR
jgi:hypothetical protein